MTNPKPKRPAKKPAAKRKPKGRRPKKAAAPDAPLIRTSERSSFKGCRWSWERNYVDNLQPIRTAPALRFGSLIHKALELRYPPGVRRGPKPAETFEKLYLAEQAEAEEKWGTFADDEWIDALELGVSMMESFINEYGRDEEWQVIASERTFRVPVPYPAHPSGEGFANLNGEQVAEQGVLFYYVGTMDGVWRNRMDKGVRIIDWKTTKGDPTKVKQLMMDDQATAYWTWGVDSLIADGILKPKDQQALDGMLYTYLRKGKPDPRPTNADGYCLNKDGTVSKSQPSPLFHRELVYRSEANRERARERASAEAIEMAAVRQGRMAVYKTPGSGPQSHCNWCGYRDLCELHESGADWEGLRDVTMTQWDPYGDHEIEEEGKGR